MSLEDVKKTLKGKANTKLNIVFDLDNTCIFAQTIKPESIKKIKKKYSWKNRRKQKKKKRKRNGIK